MEVINILNDVWVVYDVSNGEQDLYKLWPPMRLISRANQGTHVTCARSLDNLEAVVQKQLQKQQKQLQKQQNQD